MPPASFCSAAVDCLQARRADGAPGPTTTDTPRTFLSRAELLDNIMLYGGDRVGHGNSLSSRLSCRTSRQNLPKVVVGRFDYKEPSCSTTSLVLLATSFAGCSGYLGRVVALWGPFVVAGRGCLDCLDQAVVLWGRSAVAALALRAGFPADSGCFAVFGLPFRLPLNGPRSNIAPALILGKRLLWNRRRETGHWVRMDRLRHHGADRRRANRRGL